MSHRQQAIGRTARTSPFVCHCHLAKLAFKFASSGMHQTCFPGPAGHIYSHTSLSHCICTSKHNLLGWKPILKTKFSKDNTGYLIKVKTRGTGHIFEVWKLLSKTWHALRGLISCLICSIISKINSTIAGNKIDDSFSRKGQFVYNKCIYPCQKVRSTGVDKSFGPRVISCHD